MMKIPSKSQNFSTARSPIRYVRLPICDVLFCVISLILHMAAVCSVLFIAFRLRLLNYYVEFYFIVSSALLASLTVTATSFVWYFRNCNGAFRRVDLGLHVAIHLFQLTTFWRHYVFFRRIPEHAAKLLFCELLILRLLFTAVFSLPSCLLLFFTLFRNYDAIVVAELENHLLAAAWLTLMDVCWSLASFNRRVNRAKLDYLTLSWPSLLCQFFWRLGTLGSRCVTLSAYASYFNYFIVIVLAFHWILMTTGLFMFTRPKSTGTTVESSGFNRKWITQCAILGAVYVLCYYNPSKIGVKWRCALFYTIMILENSFLLTLWLLMAKSTSNWIRLFVVTVGWGAFVFGIVMMLVYYRYLHVTRLKSIFIASDGDFQSKAKMRGSFVCRLQVIPENLKTVGQWNTDRESASTSGTAAERNSNAQIGLSRNERRCRSVPNNRRHRPSSDHSAQPTIELEDDPSKTNRRSRSLPRRKNRNDIRDDNPSDQQAQGHSVTSSTFIETIF